MPTEAFSHVQAERVTLVLSPDLDNLSVICDSRGIIWQGKLCACQTSELGGRQCLCALFKSSALCGSPSSPTWLAASPRTRLPSLSAKLRHEV